MKKLLLTLVALSSFAPSASLITESFSHVITNNFSNSLKMDDKTGVYFSQDNSRSELKMSGVATVRKVVSQGSIDEMAVFGYKGNDLYLIKTDIDGTVKKETFGTV